MIKFEIVDNDARYPPRGCGHTLPYRYFQNLPSLLHSLVKNSTRQPEELPVVLVLDYDGGNSDPSTSLPRKCSRGRRGLMHIAFRPATHTQARKHGNHRLGSFRLLGTFCCIANCATSNFNKACNHIGSLYQLQMLLAHDPKALIISSAREFPLPY